MWMRPNVHAGAQQEFIGAHPLNVNDPDASKRVAEAFRKYFGAERVRENGTGTGE
jgi:hypothetical protein